VLRACAWPGNVRELGNVIERGVALSTSDTIGRDDLPEELFEITIAILVRSSTPGSIRPSDRLCLSST